MVPSGPYKKYTVPTRSLAVPTKQQNNVTKDTIHKAETNTLLSSGHATLLYTKAETHTGPLQLHYPALLRD